MLTINDIAGLVKGASEGAGLGNEFLSHIQATDGIYHMVRTFSDPEVSHVEGEHGHAAAVGARPAPSWASPLRLPTLLTVPR